MKRHSVKSAASMYSVDTTKRFDKDLKRCLKRGLDMQHLYDAIALLRTTGTLPAPVGEGLGAGSETSQLLRSTFGRSCYGKNSVIIIKNPESLTGLRDLFCALLYAIILTSCSFSDK